jgi:hypothetical protein
LSSVVQEELPSSFLAVGNPSISSPFLKDAVVMLSEAKHHSEVANYREIFVIGP